MPELETALDLLRREIRKHETDLDRARQRSNVSPEELLKLHEKTDLKKALVETILRLEQENESYKRVLREKLVEIHRLRLDVKRLEKKEETA